jgi:hypothetical protein
MTTDTKSPPLPRKEAPAYGEAFDVYVVDYDRAMESPESLHLKLALRLRAPVSRMHALLRELPALLKSDVPAGAASRFYRNMAEIGVKVRLAPPRSLRARKPEPAPEPIVPDAPPRSPPSPPREGSPDPGFVEDPSLACPECGWPRGEGERHCELCLHLFPREPGELRPGVSLGSAVRRISPLTRRGREIPDWLAWTTIVAVFTLVLVLLIRAGT